MKSVARREEEGKAEEDAKLTRFSKRCRARSFAGTSE